MSSETLLSIKGLKIEGKSTLGLAAMGFVRDGCRFAGATVHFKSEELIAASRKRRRDVRAAATPEPG